MRQGATLAAVLAALLCGAGMVLAAPAGASQAGGPAQAPADQALIVIDIQTHMCVEAAARAAADELLNAR